MTPEAPLVPRVLIVHLTLDEPALCTSLAGDANSMETFPYLPGSVLRGAIIEAYLRQQKANGTKPSEAEFRRLFIDGTIRYLNAYPTVRQAGKQQRSLPTPRSYYKGKYDDETIVDAALIAGSLLDEGLDEPKRTSEPFCYPTPGHLTLRVPKRYLAVHIGRARITGRPEVNDGAIFRYDALAAEQQFTAVVHCGYGPTAQEDRALVRGLLQATPRLMVGAARSAGYGAVTLAGLEDIDDWREVPGALPIDDDEISITLLSPAIVRNRWGQGTVAPTELAESVGRSLDMAMALEPGERQFIGVELVGGFNRTWGLPLPQEHALTMGSVITLRRPDPHILPGAKLEERLHALERDGFGERRVDGFGRVAVNWPRVKRWTAVSRPDVDGDRLEGGTAEVTIRDGAAAPQLRDVLVRLIRRRLDEGLATRANTLADYIHTSPQPSQLARLRGAVQRALAQPAKEGREALLAYLNSLEERQVTRKQFERNPLGGQPHLLAWLRAGVKDTDAIWGQLGRRQLHSLESLLTAPSNPDDPDNPNDPRKLFTPDLAYRYNLRLIDAVLARAIKGAQQREGGIVDDGRDTATV